MEWLEVNNPESGEIAELAGVSISRLPIHNDARGSLHEIWRQDEIPEGFNPKMACASWTHPGVQRGPHEHVEQDDYFIFAGPSDFQVALWDARTKAVGADRGWLLHCGESCPIQLHVPRGVVHGYRNVGKVTGLVITVASVLFQGEGRTGSVDEIRHEENPETPFQFPNP
jgi:dTDP-4-dehydrorhamnose 3,5-epimerase